VVCKLLLALFKRKLNRLRHQRAQREAQAEQRRLMFKQIRQRDAKSALPLQKIPKKKVLPPAKETPEQKTANQKLLDERALLHYRSILCHKGLDVPALPADLEARAKRDKERKVERAKQSDIAAADTTDQVGGH
jgi:hypothetical protein